MEELEAFSKKNKELNRFRRIIDYVSKNLETDDYYKSAGKVIMEVDMSVLISSLAALVKLENLNFKKATEGQKEVERRRRKLHIQCLELLLKCQELQ